jgi:Reverse transcriptase (RNA-dependent DNA polymerase)
VLGPLLFIIFINDLDLVASPEDKVLKFADDTKVSRVIRNQEDSAGLQSALDRLMAWAARWGMLFNVKKCKVMHLGRNNSRADYTMGGSVLEKTVEEKDLGVIVTDRLKPSAQCAQAARTAQAVLGQISRAFQYRDRRVFMQLYKQYVRPHLEYSVQAWAPWNVADIELLEKVQRRAVGMVSGLRSRDYEDRLAELNITTLAERRHQADMHLMYKIVHGGDTLPRANWFRPAVDAALTRQHADTLNVRVNHGRLEIRRHSYTVRVGEQWNAIPAGVKRARNAHIFKRDYAKLRNEMIQN